MPSFRTALPAPRLPFAMPDTRTWLSSLVLVTTVALYLMAAFSLASVRPVDAVAGSKVNAGSPVIPGLGTPPEPEPLQFRQVDPQDAVKINAAVPVSTLPNPAARPFAIQFASDADRLRAVECLTAAVYYEAAIEPLDGQRAVAQVVLNRVRHPAFPRSVCGVVFQGWERSTGCQFTFTCDGALARAPAPALWAKARRVAEEAIAGKVYAPVGWATHYHTNWVVPYWSSSLTKLAYVGTHIFYRWEGGWGRPPAFRMRPAGGEPQMALMRRLTSDPTSLAAAQTVDEAAAAAAALAAQAGDAPLLPGVKPTTDLAPRAVVRRYEPMTREAATAAALARSDTPVPESTHWALSGLPAKPGTPLGRKPAAAPPAQPKCLEGVRRLSPAAPGAAEKQSC
jgi:spore germination cell wall hydrolase CwlJ-like protein